MKYLLAFLSLLLIPSSVSAAVTVNFYNNGADSGTNPGSLEFENAGKVNMTSKGNNMLKNGYAQTAWNTKADGTGEWFFASKSSVDMSAYDNKTIALYAQWKPHSYRVKFNTNGGDTIKDTFVKKDETYTLPTPSKIGYEFTGWTFNGKKTTSIKNAVDTYYVANSPKRFRLDWENKTLPAGGDNNCSFRYDFQKFGMTICTCSKPSWNYNCQGCTIITENNTDYLVAYFCPSSGATCSNSNCPTSSKNGGIPDEEILVKFELNTGKVVNYKKNPHAGHCNSLTYNPENKHYYITGFTDFCQIGNAVNVENGKKESARVAEYNENFEFVKLHKPSTGANYYNYTYYDGKFYAFRYDVIDVFNTNFNLIKRYKQPFIYSQGTFNNGNFSYNSLAAFQSAAANEDYLFAPGWSNTPYRNVIGVWDRNTLELKGIFGYKSAFYIDEYWDTFKGINSTFSKEIEGMGFDKNGNLWVMSINRGAIEAQKFNKDGIPTVEVKACWKTSPWYYIYPSNNATLRLNVDNTKTSAVLKKAANKAGQKFYIQQQSDGSYKIGTGTTAGLSVIASDKTQQKWNNTNAQKWLITPSGDYFTIKNKQTGKYLSFSGNTLSISNTASLWRFQKYNDKYTVTFTDGQGKALKRESVASGKTATAPANPTRTGYTFAGWDKAFNNITNNLIVNAKWQ